MPAQARQAAIAALHTLGLTHHLDRYPDDFSGGQQQRIAIARAVVGERRLLLADEPTGSLDTLNSDQIIELLATLPSQFGTAIVLVTHEPRFASYADRVVFLRDGVIVDETPRSGAGHASRAGRGRLMGLPQWRLASRLARREVRRRPGRTLLVVFLIAVPVFGMTVGSVLVRTAAAGGDWVTRWWRPGDRHRRRATVR